MQKRLTKTCERLTLPLFFLFFFVADFACSDTFKGMLTPQTLDPLMPIVVELEDSAGKLSGTVSISSSLARQGPIISGEISGYKCAINSDVGRGVMLRLVGTCTPTVLVGRYVMRFPDARPRQGMFRLLKIRTENKAPSKIETQPKQLNIRRERGGLSVPTVAECLKVNSACLGACPRGEYNAEFLCTNNCKRKLAACKARGKNSTKNPLPRLDQNEGAGQSEGKP
jgi:hypothetical protein